MTSILATLVGIALLLVVLQDAFEVMLLPRRVTRSLRFMRLYFRSVWSLWSRLGARLPAGGRRERFLSIFGALSMVLLFAIWAAALILAFGLIEWSLQPSGGPGHAPSPLSEQAYMSGVTFFTLGYGDVAPHSAGARLVAVCEAGTGIGFIAVVIGYLPVLYQLFSRREAHVIQLDGRAGSPPTAGTMLARHAEADGLDKLDDLLREWEVWGSDLLESHLSYPMLAYYRSQHDNQSWLAALCCIMDACALILVGVADVRPLQARMTFTMARQVVVEMARSFHVQPSRYDGGDRLDAAAFARLMAVFEQAGVGWDGGPEAEETLAALRATYEPLLDGLGRYLLLPLPGWTAEDDAADHWERGPRGLIASHLIEQLSSRTGTAPADEFGAERWRRLLGRIRSD